MPEPVAAPAAGESVEAPASADNGNVPVDAPSQAAEPAPAPAPAEPTEPAAPAAPEQELFELPDGRKVDAATLASEWKNNFMPDYTKKSQALAAKDKGDLPANGPAAKPYEDPNWVPPNYGEVVRLAKEEALAEIKAQEEARAEHERTIEATVVAQLAEIKASDPTLNENALFVHANKFHFTDLRVAHANMKEMADAVKKVQKTTADNIAKRADPVSITPGAGGGQGQPASSFSNAVEYLRSLK